MGFSQFNPHTIDPSTNTDSRFTSSQVTGVDWMLVRTAGAPEETSVCIPMQ